MFEKIDGIYDVLISLIVMPVFLSVLLIWFFISYQKRKFQYENEKKDAQLREQALIIQNQEALENERNRIAAEMHDELGSGLTIIQYLSDGIVAKTTDEVIKEAVSKIAMHSTVLVSNMSEIIWAMNSRYDNFEGLIGYLRRYIVEYLEDAQMEHSFVSDEIDPSIIISGEKRRNVYLVVKEILHNSLKYSNASKIGIAITAAKDLKISIIEYNGIGFEPDLKVKDGNGLYNISRRMKQIGGSIEYRKIDADMHVEITLPFHYEKAGQI